MHSADAQMLVLTVLADGPRHGYAINTAIEELTGRKLGPGSLYGALSRLEATEAGPARRHGGRGRRPAPHDADHRRGPRRAARRTGADGPRQPGRPARARDRAGMRPSALMAALYPPAVRERWGAEISRQVSESGIRSWPDALLGAVRLWLHPGDWPETSDGQTRQVLDRHAIRRHRRHRAAGARRRRSPSSPAASAIRPRACGSPRSCSAPPSPPRLRRCDGGHSAGWPP